MPGVMSWEDLDWAFPDFEETRLIYHGTRTEHLPSIMVQGLLPAAAPDPEDQHHTIYEALHRRRPASIPEWVDPRRCVFGYMNKKRFGIAEEVIDGRVTGGILGIRVTPPIMQQIWTGIVRFSDWLYCPDEAGYFDTDARAAYYRETLEPVVAEAYWKTSMSFEDNLQIRHDHLLYTQGYFELLICLDLIDPSVLSLQGLRVTGSNGAREIIRSQCPDLFSDAESLLRQGAIPREQFETALGKERSSGDQ